MRKFRKIMAMILSLCILATVGEFPVTVSAAGNDLKFDANGDFKIVIFSDVQDQFPVHQRVIRIMGQAIEREDPDLVVFLGDNTEQNIKDPEVDFRRSLEQILGPVVEAGVPYAFVFGNHDDQSYYSGQRTDKEAMLAVYQSIGDCRTVDADPTIYGTGTCKIPIYASDSNSVAFNLFMVDSNAYQNPLNTSSGYGSVQSDQLAWLTANNDSGVSSLVFQHIPMPEYYNLLVENANGSRNYGGKTYAMELNSNATGYLGEFPAPCPANCNNGEFDTLKSMQSVLGVFTGHDHLNDYTGTYDGIRLTAVPGMTYQNYGSESVRGYGVIELDESDLSSYDYHSVKFSTLDAESHVSTETTYDVYDEIGYSDLRKNDAALPSTEYNIHGSNTFTYTATSPSNSAIFKFRYIAGSDTGIQFSFDEGDNGNVAYPFGVWVKKPNQGNAGGYGAWHLKPNVSSTMVDMESPIVEGNTYDIEMGRLKVLTGDPVHLGEYYLYLKVNGTLIKETYTNTSEDGRYMSGEKVCQVSNKLRFGDWSSNDNGNKIAPYSDTHQQTDPPVTETYENYDIITYADLLDTGSHHLSEGGTTLTAQNNLFYYNATSATHSAIYRFRYEAGSSVYFQIFPGAYRSGDPFAYRLANATTYEKRYAPGNTTKDVGHTIAAGETIDFEIGRLMVASGKNAGKYHTYLKANDTVIFSEYVSTEQATGTDLNDSIQLNLNGSNSCVISASPAQAGPDPEPEPETETYFDYDEVTYNDLRGNGSPLAEEFRPSSSTINTFTYDKTSETGSAVLKLRWKPAANTEMQLGFDTLGSSGFEYMFGVQVYKPDSTYPNGSIWLRPGYSESTKASLPEALTSGKTYDIEFARLKVKTGPNTGKYYVYFKMNGELLKDDYVDANVVDGSGNYTSNPGSAACTVSNKIFITIWGDGGAARITAIPEPETFEAYDDLTFDNLLYGSASMAGQTVDGSRTYTYNATSPTYSMKLKFRWTAGSQTKFTVFLDDWVYPFCFAAKLPNQTDFGAAAGANGAWHLVPSNNDMIVQMSEPIVTGQNYDIEIGRLKVASGANAGKYYVYFIVDGNLIQSYYYDGVNNGVYGNANTALQNKIIFSSPAGNKFSAIPVPETFEAYDDLTFDNLLENGVSVAGQTKDGSHNFTYNATSPTYSMKLKYRWTAGETPKFTTYLDEWVYPFCFAVKTPNQTGFGEPAGPNGAWHLVPSDNSMIVQMDEPIVPGQDYDIEVGRLKVATGSNAGKYYVYFMVDGELIQSYYYDGVSGGVYGSKNTPLSNTIIFSAPAGNKISAIPVPETYEPYDEINYEDLKKNGESLNASGTAMVGATVFNYTSTSATGSAIFKFNWTIGSVPKFQLSFEKSAADAMEYMFGAWLYAPESGHPNGKLWLRPSYGPEEDLATALTAGSSHNVEFGRLKMKTGAHTGKYYVYIKIDNELIAEDYVAANIVDASGNYTSNPGNAALNVKTGEIIFTFWGSEGNIISAFREEIPNNHEGITGDFDNDRVISGADVAKLRKILAGAIDLTEMPAGIADFNKDGAVDLIDLIEIKVHLTLSTTDSYTKSGSLTIGMQEHLLEDETKTAAYIADATATIGASAYRLSMPISSIYYATNTNDIAVRTAGLNSIRSMVSALKAKGINKILYVTDAFVLPYGYLDPTVNHNVTVPDPVNERDDYIRWLQINAKAFAALAAAVPEIKFIEPFNEINLITTRLEKTGVAWNSTEQEQANFKYTVAEKAAIMADLCWYISCEVKAVNPAIQVTTPSMSVSTASHVEQNFLSTFYETIEAGICPTGQAVGDVRIDNYFTIVNLHDYPEYADSNLTAKANAHVSRINSARTVMTQHKNGKASVWLTETGVSTIHGNGTYRDEEKAGTLLNMTLSAIDSSLTYIDAVFIYKIADISSDNGASPTETGYGLFYSGDDLDHDPYAAKGTARAVYSFLHGGSTNYSALTALAGRYE